MPSVDLGRLSFSGYSIVDGNDDGDCALVVRDRCDDVGVRCDCDVLVCAGCLHVSSGSSYTSCVRCGCSGGCDGCGGCGGGDCPDCVDMGVIVDICVIVSVMS